MDIDRSLEPISEKDLLELYEGSISRLRQYFVTGKGIKWSSLYNIEKPLAVALCQGAAMHYYDQKNGIKDFDIWFFYPFNKTHLPYRTVWSWDYKNIKFGHHPSNLKGSGREVDVIIRSIRNYPLSNPINTIHQYLMHEGTPSASELGKKAVVMLYPKEFLGKVIWYRGEKVDKPSQ